MKKNTFLIIHGTGGTPERNWFPWLKKELEKQGNKVLVPAFPTPEHQSLNNWLEVFDKAILDRKEPLILIGHSIGVAFALRIIERGLNNIEKAVFVAGFVKKLNNEWFDNLNSTFIDVPFNWGEIKANCKNFKLYAGNKDPYVPSDIAQELAANLGQKLILIKEGGHLNAEFGYLKFEELLKDLDPAE